MHQYKKIHPQTRLIIAGTIGFLIAILATIRIWFPTLLLLDQFAQFSPLIRVVIAAKLLSPLLSFLLAGGWVWVLLLLGERLLLLQESTENTNHIQPSQNTILQERRYRLEQPGNPYKEDSPQPPHGSERGKFKRQIAAPPFFQFDPANPWQQTMLPVTPFPMTNPGWSPKTERVKKIEEINSKGAHQQEETYDNHTHEQEEANGNYVSRPEALSDNDTNGQEKTNSNHANEQGETAATPAEQVVQSTVINISPQQEEQAKTIQSERSQNTFSLQKSGASSEAPPPVTLTLLKQIRCWIRADDGTSMEVKLRGGENAIRLILLAYIAWRRGAWADRDKMLTHVVAKGKRHDMNTDQLGEVFDAAKRYLRQDLDRARKEMETHGHQVAQGIDFFSNEPGFYQLHSSCRVNDLEKIEELYNTIQMARKEGVLNEKLNGTIPDWVVETCQKLIEAYPGDFLQSLLEKFPEEFGSWVKEPFTLYRDKYLDALLIIANYESALGRNYLDEDLITEKNEEQRRYHIGRAAQLFYDYAMYAINSRWDQKLKFMYRAGKDGERVIRSERAMRRCVVELGKLGNPDMIDQAYLSFKERMSTLSEGTWKPGRDTESDVAEAKRTTSEYRFSSQIPSR